MLLQLNKEVIVMYVYVWAINDNYSVYRSKENAIKDFSEWAKNNLIDTGELKENELQELIENFKNIDNDIYIDFCGGLGSTFLEKILTED
jgi:hypothetical protein